MSSSFQKLKEDSQSGKLRKDIYGQMGAKTGTWTKTRVRNCLVGLGDNDLAKKILDCRKGQLCGQVYCPDCRKTASLRLKDRITDHIQSSYGSNEEKTRNQLRHVTILCELVSFDLVSVKKSVSQGRKDINSFRRKFKDIWFQGAFEFELIEMNKLMVWNGQNQIKKETLTVMDSAVGKSDERILVHFHGLMDLNGTDEKDVKEWVSKKWNDHPRQTHIQRIHSNQSLEDMSWKVSSYCFKNRVRDNMTFIAKGFMEGDYFTNDQLSRLIKLYDDVGGQKGVSGILIGFGGN